MPRKSDSKSLQRLPHEPPKRKKPKVVVIDRSDDDKKVGARKPVKKISKTEFNERKTLERDLLQKPEDSSNSNIKAGKLRRRALLGVSGGLVVVLAVVFSFKFNFVTGLGQKVEDKAPNCLGVHPNIKWGYKLSDLECTWGVTQENQTIQDLLLDRDVHWKTIRDIKRKLVMADLPMPNMGNKYTILYPKLDPKGSSLFAFEPDSTRMILVNLDGKTAVYTHDRKVVSSTLRKKSILLQSDFADAMFNQEFGLKLSTKMEDILKWKIDFFHLKPGEQFKIVYEENRYEGGVTVLGKIRAVHFHGYHKDHFAFYLADGKKSGYYDELGRPVKSTFLQAPLKYGRISSHYNHRRVDPVLKNGSVRPHLGTDYAAPIGTPILAVADGFVTKAEKKGGNGNYVKLRHDNQTETQYLHMRNFAKGIKEGTKVSQGQVLGYVGTTGRTTGPHVCFRYWKNGVQVDHLKEDFPSLNPLKGPTADRFLDVRDSLRVLLDEID